MLCVQTLWHYSHSMIHLQVVAAVLGTLVNVSSHPIGRNGLLSGFGDDGDAIDRLCALLKRLSLQHAHIVVLICQVLYNMVTSSEFDASQLDDHYEVLQEVADSVDIMLDISMTANGDVQIQSLAPVGTALLEYLRSVLKK